MRNKWIIGSVTAGLMFGGLAMAGPVRVESKRKEMDQITCEEFLTLNPDD